MVNLQYSNSDLLGQDLVAQAYYRDETQTFYPFPRWAVKAGLCGQQHQCIRAENRFLRR